MDDNQMFVVDFQKESLIGKASYCIKCFTSCCLTTMVSSRATQQYLSRLEEKLARHCLIECPGQLHTTHRSKKAFWWGLNKIGRQIKDLMINAKKKYRMIKSGRIPFLPEAAFWVCCMQVYQFLLWYHNGLIRNQGNLKRMAHCCGIPNCLSILIEEILLHLKVCLEKCDFYKNGKQYCCKHLHQCLKNTQESN